MLLPSKVVKSDLEIITMLFLPSFPDTLCLCYSVIKFFFPPPMGLRLFQLENLILIFDWQLSHVWKKCRNRHLGCLFANVHSCSFAIMLRTTLVYFCNSNFINGWKNEILFESVFVSNKKNVRFKNSNLFSSWDFFSVIIEHTITYA